MPTHAPRWLTLATLAALSLGAAPAVAADDVALTVGGRPLAGAVVAPGTTVTAPDLGGTVKAKFRLDGTYLGTDLTLPYSWPAPAAPGSHELEVRLYDEDGEQHRMAADFTVGPGTAPVATAPAAGAVTPPVATPAPVPAGDVLTASGRPLAAAVIASGTSVTAPDLGGTVKAKFRLDGTYLGTDVTLPYSWPVQATPGRHELEVRLYGRDGEQGRRTATFTVGSTPTVPATPPTAAPPALPPTLPPTLPAGTGRTVTVRDGAGLVAALAAAVPGTTIVLADGVYTAKQQFTIATACTAAAPCTLRGGRGAVLDGTGLSGHYGLHLEGAPHWTVAGLTVRNGSKGIVVDGSDHVVVDSVEVAQIGAEGIHLRAFSSDGVVRDSLVHDVGITKPQFGEGIYIGSAKSNWGTYSGGLPDASNRNRVTGNRIWATGAESIDIKEGTTGGLVSGNTFDGAGMAGENSADSWVDVKGNEWVVEGNTGTNALLDGFQTHVLLPGWGERNVFRGNRATVASTGYAFRIHNAAATGNVVTCDNVVVAAGSGLANQRCA